MHEVTHEANTDYAGLSARLTNDHNEITRLVAIAENAVRQRDEIEGRRQTVAGELNVCRAELEALKASVPTLIRDHVAELLRRSLTGKAATK